MQVVSLLILTKRQLLQPNVRATTLIIDDDVALGEREAMVGYGATGDEGQSVLDAITHAELYM